MRILLLLPVACLVFSCAEKKKPKQIVSLRKEYLFNQDTVRRFLSSVSEDQADSSKQIFLKGIDLLKNNNRASDDVEPKARLSVTTERHSLDP